MMSLTRLGVLQDRRAQIAPQAHPHVVAELLGGVMSSIRLARRVVQDVARRVDLDQAELLEIRLFLLAWPTCVSRPALALAIMRSIGLASPRRGKKKLIVTATRNVRKYQPARPRMCLSVRMIAQHAVILVSATRL